MAKHRIHGTITDILSEINSPISKNVRLGVIEKLGSIKTNYGEGPGCGALVVVFDKPYNEKFFGRYKNRVTDMHENLVRDCPGKNSIFCDSGEELLKQAACKNNKGIDGSILIDNAGNLIATGYYLNVDAKYVADHKLKVPNHRPLWQRYKFNEEVGTKHNNGISWSCLEPNAIVYAMSEESKEPKIRVFKEGRIIASPYDSEILSTGPLKKSTMKIEDKANLGYFLNMQLIQKLFGIQTPVYSEK